MRILKRRSDAIYLTEMGAFIARRIKPVTTRLFIGRMLLGGFVSMVAGVVLVQFPDMPLTAVCGLGSMLGIAGYQVVEIAIARRLKSLKGGDDASH